MENSKIAKKKLSLMMLFQLIKLNVPNVEEQEILKHLKIQEELA